MSEREESLGGYGLSHLHCEGNDISWNQGKSSWFEKILYACEVI